MHIQAIWEFWVLLFRPPGEHVKWGRVEQNSKNYCSSLGTKAAEYKQERCEHISIHTQIMNARTELWGYNLYRACGEYIRLLCWRMGEKQEAMTMVASLHVRQLMGKTDLPDSPIKKILQTSVPDTLVRTWWVQIVSDQADNCISFSFAWVAPRSNQSCCQLEVII